MAAWPHPCARIEIDAKPKLGNAPRRLRPMARFRAAFRAGESTDVVLIGKARHGVVGLRLEHPADEPPLGMDTEDGQGVAPAAERRACRLGEMLDKRGDEDCLACPREARHAEADVRSNREPHKAIGCRKSTRL